MFLVQILYAVVQLLHKSGRLSVPPFEVPVNKNNIIFIYTYGFLNTRLCAFLSTQMRYVSASLMVDLENKLSNIYKLRINGAFKNQHLYSKNIMKYNKILYLHQLDKARCSMVIFLNQHS